MQRTFYVSAHVKISWGRKYNSGAKKGTFPLCLYKQIEEGLYPGQGLIPENC